MFVRIRKVPQQQRFSVGFTVLELMIATSIFAVMLLVLAVGIIRFSNDYYKGITSSKTQAAARAIMMQISDAITFGKTVTVIDADPNGVAGVCVDNALYSYKLGQQVTDSAPNALLHQGYHGLVAAVGAACTPTLPGTPSLPAGSRELLGQHMRLGALTVSSTGNIYTVRVRVIYGDDDLLLPTVNSSTDFATTTEGCSGTAGQQFCAVSDLTTTVERRLL